MATDRELTDSEVYRRAAELMLTKGEYGYFKGKVYATSYACIAINLTLGTDRHKRTPQILRFARWFKPSNATITESWFEDLDRTEKQCRLDRVTALLLMSEIAKTEDD